MYFHGVLEMQHDTSRGFSVAEPVDSFQVDAIVGEPFFAASLLPWHNLYFWYAAASAARLASPGVKILPCRATLRAVAGKMWR